MKKKQLAVYEVYERQKESFNISPQDEDVFRKGFVMGYCAACDQHARAKKINLHNEQTQTKL